MKPKLCPFCGQKPHELENRQDYSDDIIYAIRCKCGIGTKMSESKKELIKIWNTRIN